MVSAALDASRFSRWLSAFRGVWIRLIERNSHGIWIAAVVAVVSSMFAGAFLVSAVNPDEIEIRVFDDIAADGLADGVPGDVLNPGLPNVTIAIFVDDGSTPNVRDSDDNKLVELVTDVDGIASTAGLDPAEGYWAVVVADTIDPLTGASPVNSNWLAEQTYGPANSIDPAGALTASAGPLYGGHDPVGNDESPNLMNGDHVALLSPGDPTADFGFSFNVVVNTVKNESQGTFQQFIENANNIEGPNAMRFVPMVPTNGPTNGDFSSGRYWFVVPDKAPIDLSDEDTTIDGRAWAADGTLQTEAVGPVSPRAGNALGTRTATVYPVPKAQFQIYESSFRLTEVAGVRPHNTKIRNLHIYPKDQIEPSVDVNGVASGTITGVRLSELVLGTSSPLVSEPDPGPGRDYSLRGSYAPGMVVENSYIINNDIRMNQMFNSPGSIFRNNEFRIAAEDAIRIDATSPGSSVEGNYFEGSGDYCLEIEGSTGTVVRDNTFSGCGNGVNQSGGMRVSGTATVEYNTFVNNVGPGIVVAGQSTSQGWNAGRAVISDNSFSGNAGIAIDNHAQLDPQYSGDGVTLNDGALDPLGGNSELDYPVITGVNPSGPGTVTAGGTSACGSCRLEIYSADGQANDLGGDGEVHGEGTRLLASVITDGSGDWKSFVPVDGSFGQIAAIVIDDVNGLTSEFSANVSVEMIGGQVFLDENGDAVLDDTTPVANATVRIYADPDGSGITPQATDPLLATLTTDVDGRWSHESPTTGYWVSVDSRTVAPPALNPGFTAGDVWAEQTYGPTGSRRANYTGATQTVDVLGADGPAVGGVRGAQSDDASTLPGSEHHFFVPADSDRVDLDTAFSFNVVSNVAGGNLADDDPAANRTRQGTLRQFLQNAAAIPGPNAMRFVPTVPTNAPGWWRIVVTDELPATTDANTTISGQQYDLTDPTVGLDSNRIDLVAARAVGTADTSIRQVDAPELELWGDRSGDPNMVGLRLRATRSRVDNMAFLGFSAGIDIGEDPGDSTSVYTILRNTVGIDNTSGGDPGGSNRNDTGLVVRFVDDVTIQENLIGFPRDSAIDVLTGARNTVVTDNHIISPSAGALDRSGIGMFQASNVQVINNYISGAMGFAIDGLDSTGPHVISGNTIEDAGKGSVNEGAVRLFGSGSTVQNNMFDSVQGAPVVVVGEFDPLADPDGGTNDTRPALGISVSGNEFGTLDPYAVSNGGGPATAVDLVGPAAANPTRGDGPTVNDGAGDGCGYNDPLTGNRGIDYPVLTARQNGAVYDVTGTGCPGSTVHIYRASGPTGTATTPVATLTVDGAGEVLGIVPATAGSPGADFVTASQTNAASTSEFSPPFLLMVEDQPPVINDPGPQSATEAMPFSLTVTGDDPDDTGEMWSMRSNPPGSAIDSLTGVLTWTPTEADGGSSFFPIVQLTADGQTTELTVRIDVVEVDTPPAIDPIPTQNAVIGTPGSYAAVGSDPDTPVDSLLWTLVDGADTVPAWLTIDGAGLISFNPTIAGITDVLVRVAEVDGPSSTTPLTIVATDPVGPPPVVTPPGPQTVVEGDSVVVQFSGTDTTSWTADGAPPGASFDAALGRFTWTSGEDDGGSTVVFAVTATGPGGSTGSSASVTINELNAPPELAPIADTTVIVGNDLSVLLSATDPDRPSQTLTFTIVAAPPGPTIAGSELRWDAVPTVGDFTIRVGVSDDGTPSLSDQEVFTVTVTAVPTTTTAPPTTAPPTTASSTTTSNSDRTSTTLAQSSTTTSAVTTTTVIQQTTVKSTVPPSTTPDAVGSSTTLPPLPIDEQAIAPPPPPLERPTDQPFEPELSITGGIAGIIAAPSSVSVPRSAVVLSGAWIFMLGIPLILWERKRAVSAIAGVGADETVPVYATRTSTLPLAYLRPDASMLWWRFRFMGLGEGQRVQIDSPLGRVWVDRDRLQPLHRHLEQRRAS